MNSLNCECLICLESTNSKDSISCSNNHIYCSSCFDDHIKRNCCLNFDPISKSFDYSNYKNIQKYGHNCPYPNCKHKFSEIFIVKKCTEDTAELFLNTTKELKSYQTKK